MIEHQPKRRPLLGFTEVRRMHPYQTMLYFAMAASGFTFLVMLTLYTFQRFDPDNVRLGIRLPKFFIASTGILLASSFTVFKSKFYLTRDHLKKSVLYLFISFLLGLVFAGLQLGGWIEFYRSGFMVPTSNVASLYIYVLSSVHLIHLVIGFGFLLYILIPGYRKSLDVVQELILVTNPFQKKKLELFAIYWHYIDAVWLILFFYLLLTS